MDASGQPEHAVLADLLSLTDTALSAAETFFASARQAVSDLVVVDGRAKGALVEQHQTAVHGLAWFATYVEGLRQMREWAGRLQAEGRFDTLEQLMLQAAFGEYLSQLSGGIALSQLEIVRPNDLGIPDDAHHALISNDGVRTLMANGNTDAVRLQIAAFIEDELDK